MTSPTTARGVWALEDVVRFGPGVNLRGYGHYTETYEKVDGQWLFTSSTLTRLREDVFNGLVAVYISDRIRRVDRQSVAPGDEVTEAPVAYPPNTALGRFGIAPIVDSADPFVSSMPLAGLVNPLTGAPTVGPLAVLVDHAAGLVNHYRKAADEWTRDQRVDAGDHPGRLDRRRGPPGGSGGRDRSAYGRQGLESALGMCEITVGDAVIGIGTVRSVYVAHPGEFPQELASADVDGAAADGTRRDHGATDRRCNGSPALHQAAESGAEQHPRHRARRGRRRGSRAGRLGRAQCRAADQPLHTASLRVNFLRQFFSGDESRYVGTALRVGRRSGVAEAQAIGADGEVALIARVTAYRLTVTRRR